MATYTNLQGYRPGQQFMYQRSHRHVTNVFNQENLELHNNQPLMAFQYYVVINLNNVATARQFIQDYFDNSTLNQLAPLIKSVDMPSFKVETATLDQYNRKRVVQTNISYEPIKMVFHDVADGKTLMFWEMYYRYYFGDGNEPGINQSKLPPSLYNAYSNELSPGLITSSSFNSRSTPTPFDTIGDKRTTNNVISDNLNSHLFGYNLDNVQNIKHLIQSIEIFQVHAGKFNSVTLVNPRISGFNHSTLDYSKTDASMELTFTVEYEYAYYNIFNQSIGGSEVNNNSSIDPFSSNIPLEVTSTPFTVKVNSEVNTRMVPGSNRTAPRLSLGGVASQLPLGSISSSRSGILSSLTGGVSNFTQNIIGTASILSGPFPVFNDLRRVTSQVIEGLPPIIPEIAAGVLQGRSLKTQVANSVLNGVVQQLPPGLAGIAVPAISARSFKSAATGIKSAAYQTVFRTLTGAL